VLGISPGHEDKRAPQGDAHHTDALPLFVHHVKHDFHAIPFLSHQPAPALAVFTEIQVQVALPWGWFRCCARRQRPNGMPTARYSDYGYKKCFIPPADSRPDGTSSIVLARIEVILPEQRDSIF